MITNDAVVTGLLAVILGAVFYTYSHPAPFWRNFYRFVPAILLCYFLPSLLTTFGIIDGEESRVYFVASRYLLPAALVLEADDKTFNVPGHFYSELSSVTRSTVD